MKIVWSKNAKRRDDPDVHCYVLAIKRRTSTTYLHEEKATYGCSAN